MDLQWLLLENPYPLAALCAAAWVILWALTERGEPAWRGWAKRALLPAALLVVILAEAIETDREAITRAANDLHRAVETRSYANAAAFFKIGDAPKGEWTKFEVDSSLRLGVPLVTRAELKGIEVTVTGDLAVAKMKTRVETGGTVLVVSYELTWTRRPEGWAITGVRDVRWGAGLANDTVVRPGGLR